MTNTIIDLPTWQYCRARQVAPALTEPDAQPPLRRVLQGDAATVLRQLPTASFDCVVTSPPYHLLRRYGAGEKEIGTETHVDDYVDRLLGVCDQIARVLTPTGTLFLNLGDSFSRGPRYGAPPKSLLLAPERLLLELAARGWYVRNKIVWAKPNPMPNSIADRFSTTWEPIYLLARSERYYFDLDVARVPHKTTRRRVSFKNNTKYGGRRPSWAGPLAGANDGLERTRAEGRAGHPLGKNPGDVWTIPTAGYRGAHFAVFPEDLVHRPILVGCPERVCTSCSRPWERHRRRDRIGDIRPACTCAAPWRPGRVPDPFIGAGTVGVAAEHLGRDWLGVELNPQFVTMAAARIEQASRKVNQPDSNAA